MTKIVECPVEGCEVLIPDDRMCCTKHWYKSLKCEACSLDAPEPGGAERCSRSVPTAETLNAMQRPLT